MDAGIFITTLFSLALLLCFARGFSDRKQGLPLFYRTLTFLKWAGLLLVTLLIWVITLWFGAWADTIAVPILHVGTALLYGLLNIACFFGALVFAARVINIPIESHRDLVVIDG